MKLRIDHILYHPLRAILVLLSLLPMWLLYGFSTLLAPVVQYVVRYRRKVITRNLAAAFPDKTDAQRRAIKRQFYRFFCDYLVESLKFATIRRNNIRKRMHFVNPEVINNLVDNNRSVALLLGHYGNWEWVTTLALHVNRPDGGYGHLYHPLESRLWDRLFLSVRNRMGSQSIAMNDTLRFIHKYESQGLPTVIGYISDQVPLWHNIHHWLTFLNQETPVFTGVERIAARHHQAVAYIDIRRVRRGYYEARFELLTDNAANCPPTDITNRYFALLEQTIRRNPPYWLWSHNRWKRTREEFDRHFKVLPGGRVVDRQQPPEEARQQQEGGKA